MTEGPGQYWEAENFLYSALRASFLSTAPLVPWSPLVDICSGGSLGHLYGPSRRSQGISPRCRRGGEWSPGTSSLSPVSSSRLAGIVRASQSLELFMEESNLPKDIA